MSEYVNLLVQIHINGLWNDDLIPRSVKYQRKKKSWIHTSVISFVLSYFSFINIFYTFLTLRIYILLFFKRSSRNTCNTNNFPPGINKVFLILTPGQCVHVGCTWVHLECLG